MANFPRRHSNLQSFLEHTTPSVPVYTLQKSGIRNLFWLPVHKDNVEFFTLGDLWDQYAEWSVYGVGVPIHRNNEKVIQYFTPTLSAIQIYTSKTLASPRTVLDETQSESSDDSGSEKLSKSWDDVVSENSVLDNDGSLQAGNPWGQLYFQFIEYGSPYERVPLIDKVNQLAEYYHGLKSFKSMELSPASWMAVAWHPIYQIPTCLNDKEFSASFLTFHTISALFQEDNLPKEMIEDSGILGEKHDRKQKYGSNRVNLSPFGLVTYKMQGNLWRNRETKDDMMLSMLSSAAFSWLKQLGVQHHDHDFFITH